MSRLRRFHFKVRAWWRDARLEAEMAEEMRAHLERLEAAHRNAGLAPEAARYAAVRQFGNVASIQERAREQWHFGWLEQLMQDLRYASRSLRRSPVFALAVIGSLVLGIGANVTVITLMRAALWRPLPVSHPGQIVHLRRTNPAHASGSESSFSYVLLQQLRESAGPAAQIIAKTSAKYRKFGLDPSSRERVIGEAVSEDFFTVLGVLPAAGRVLAAGDDAPAGGQRVAVLSERFWRSQFNADPAVVGRTVYYDEAPFMVVGVAMPGFDGVDAERHVQVWIPVTADVTITPAWLRDASFYWLTLLARVPPSSNVPALQGIFDARFRAHLETEVLPDLSPRFRAMFGGEHLQLRPAAAGLATTGRRYEPQLRVLAGVALCLFLICCANVASLVRARNARRQGEFALRRALGAGNRRILQQLLVEGSLLGLIGILGSLLAAQWMAGVLIALLPTNSPLAFDLRPDLVILAIGVALGTAATVVAITFPAWREGKSHTVLRGVGRSTKPAVVSHATVAAQLAIVLVLLVVAGLTLSMLRRLIATELGFEPAAVTVGELSFPRGTPDARMSAALEAVRRRLDDSGAVESASYASPAVYDTGGTSMTVVPTDYAPAPGEDTQAGIVEVGPDFFATLHIPVHQGRTFTSTDLTAATSIVIVNETFARKYFVGRTVVGQSVRIPGRLQPTIATIVGVVGDVRHYGVRSEPWPMVYRPGAVSGARLLVRAREPGAGTSLVRSVVAAVDPTAQIESVRGLEEIVAAMVSRERLLGVLSSVVAMIAMTLAALGLYGIVAYSVTCRRTEFGIRLALGAQRADIRRLVLCGTLKVVAIGLAAGIPAAAAASQIVTQVVPDAPTTDWLLMFSAAMALVAVMTLAAWIPAWRAASTDPAWTLRYE